MYKRGSFFFGLFLCLYLLIPHELQAQQKVYQILAENQSTDQFAQTVRKAGLDSQLNSGGPYTIFAPSNRALRQIGDRLNRNNASALRKFVLNHILTGMATKRHITAMSKAPSLGGLTLRIQEDKSGSIKVNNVTVTQYNIRARNGVIHVIEGVLE